MVTLNGRVRTGAEHRAAEFERPARPKPAVSDGRFRVEGRQAVHARCTALMKLDAASRCALGINQLKLQMSD